MYSRKSVGRFNCVHLCYKVHIFLFCFLKRFWTLSFIFDITSYNFLQVFVLLNARKRLFWIVSCNLNFIWRTLQCLFLILGIIGSFLFYGFRQGIFMIFIFFLVSLFDQYCLSYLFSLSRCSPHSLFYDFFWISTWNSEYPWHVMGYWPPRSVSPLPPSPKIFNPAPQFSNFLLSLRLEVLSSSLTACYVQRWALCSNYLVNI